ncbi:hypothetical protein [Gemmobacter sp.]|uniref:hypothetical protein n=1 Tax=Gemmobacter sp. TaxID=1898957 RepID=UPI002AFFCF1E|nr:hypothetical protein [Gemmobacter sp.]
MAVVKTLVEGFKADEESKQLADYTTIIDDLGRLLAIGAGAKTYQRGVRRGNLEGMIEVLKRRMEHAFGLMEGKSDIARQLSQSVSQPKAPSIKKDLSCGAMLPIAPQRICAIYMFPKGKRVLLWCHNLRTSLRHN